MLPCFKGKYCMEYSHWNFYINYSLIYMNIMDNNFCCTKVFKWTQIINLSWKLVCRMKLMIMRKYFAQSEVLMVMHNSINARITFVCHDFWESRQFNLWFISPCNIKFHKYWNFINSTPLLYELQKNTYSILYRIIDQRWLKVACVPTLVRMSANCAFVLIQTKACSLRAVPCLT